MLNCTTFCWSLIEEIQSGLDQSARSFRATLLNTRGIRGRIHDFLLQRHMRRLKCQPGRFWTPAGSKTRWSRRWWRIWRYREVNKTRRQTSSSKESKKTFICSISHWFECIYTTKWISLVVHVHTPISPLMPFPQGQIRSPGWFRPPAPLLPPPSQLAFSKGSLFNPTINASPLSLYFMLLCSFEADGKGEHERVCPSDPFI